MTPDMVRQVGECLAIAAMRRGEPIRAACHLLISALPDDQIDPLLARLVKLADEDLTRQKDSA